MYLNNTFFTHCGFSIEKMPSLLELSCYIHEGHQSISSYDAFLVSYLNGNGIPANFYLWKVIADYYSPILLEELDELADALPKCYLPWDTGAQLTKWKFMFIVPKSIKDNFKVQPYLGVGKYEWEAKGFIQQHIFVADV